MGSSGYSEHLEERRNMPEFVSLEKQACHEMKMRRQQRGGRNEAEEERQVQWETDQQTEGEDERERQREMERGKT